jgi:hypothetical protein
MNGAGAARVTWEVVNRGNEHGSSIFPQLWYIFARLYGVTTQETAL